MDKKPVDVQKFVDAIDTKNEASLASLIASKADPSGTTSWGSTPLHYAVQMMWPAGVKLLVKSGANLEAKDADGNTPLIKAAEQGYGDSAAILLSAGASPNVRNHDGLTALMLAGRRGYLSVMRSLIAKGADLRATTEGKSVLYWTAIGFRPDAVAELIKYKIVKIDAQSVVKDLKGWQNFAGPWEYCEGVVGLRRNRDKIVEMLK